MPDTLNLPTITKINQVRAEIDRSEDVQDPEVIEGDGLLIVHSVTEPAGQYWDVVYSDAMTRVDELTLGDLFQEVYEQTGFQGSEIEVERETNLRPHPLMPGSNWHTYIRLCPKVAM